jgi:DNA (cytosine-5)-methyltransferase 1
MIRFIGLFAGIGGFRYGLESIRPTKQAFQKGQNSRDSVRGRSEKEEQGIFNCVWSNDWDKYACEIYKKHYKVIDQRDITTISAKEIPDHDLLCAGFPCQSFSVAGKRRGFEDTRGTLFFEICKVAKEKQPRLLLLENVKGLLSHEEGKTFHTIIRSLDELGYDLQ